MNYEEENNYPKALMVTGIIMVALVFLCYIIIMENPPVQIDGTGGVVVNYGTTDAGMGKDISSTEEPSVAPNANHMQTTKVTPTPPTEQKSQVETSQEKVVTQDNEDAPAVTPNSKKSKSPATAEVAKPVKKEVVNQAALYKGPSKAGNGGGDGTTNTPGNQGSKNGSTLSDNYGPGGSGNGLNMAGNWSLFDPPDGEEAHNVPGGGGGDFTVDQNGNVIKASYNRRKTKAELNMIQSCEAAIKKCKFNSSTPVSGDHDGEYTFLFKVK